MGQRILTLVGIMALTTACAGGVYVEDLSDEARTDYEGYRCEAQGVCGEGLACLHGACIRLCRADTECGGRSCLPFPDSDDGWCSLGEALAPLTDVEETEEPAPAPEPTAEPQAPTGPRIPNITGPSAPATPEAGEDGESEGMTIHSIAPPAEAEPEAEPAPIVAEPSDEDEPAEEPAPIVAEPAEEAPVEEAPAPDAQGVSPVAAPSCDEVRANQSLDSALLLAGGERIEDVICAGRADFYRVSVVGFWLLQLAADDIEQGLMVYLWDPATNAPATGFDGGPIRSIERFGDEVLAFLGEQIVVVVGPEEERAEYELNLFAL